MTLVLQALGSDQALDAGGLGVGLLALTLGLDLAANDVLADLDSEGKICISFRFLHSDSTRTARSASAQLEGRR